jgi:hypothetical protein
VVAGVLMVIVASGFKIYHWVGLGAWAATGLAQWLARPSAPAG